MSGKKRDAVQTVYAPAGPNLSATAAQARAALDANGLGVDGTGIKVGVISDSFDQYGSEAATSEQNGNLPDASKIHVLNDLSFLKSNTLEDEGRAMMEVVHDLAPGANLDFCTYAGTAADFQQGIEYSDQAFADSILALAADGCKVICDDVVVPGTPWFQSGVIEKAIQTVEQEGVTYLTAAGNMRSAPSQTATAVADPAYQSAWKQTSISVTFGTNVSTFSDALNFGKGGFQTITLAPGASTYLEMQWNDPWGADSPQADLALIVSQNGHVLQNPSTGEYALFDRDQNGTPLGESTNLGLDPFVDQYGDAKFSTLTNNTGAPLTLQVSIVNLDALQRNPGLVKYFAYDNGDAPGAVTIDGANAGSATGHQESPYAITVGAVDAGNTPAFGSTRPLSEFFSSSGTGDEYTYDVNGQYLTTPQMLNVVDISGIDDIATDVGRLTDFYGTSAAAPSIAAVAALMLASNGALLQPDIQDLLQDSAVPMINPAVAGAGLADAAKAVRFASTLREVSRGSNTLLEGTHLNDILIAAGTNNVLVGGAGDDNYYINNTSDQVVENSGEGTDTVFASASFSIQNDPNVENMRLTGTAAIAATGNDGANRLIGNGAADTILGLGGNDTIVVLATPTLVDGGAGTDTLYIGGNGTIVLSDNNYRNIERVVVEDGASVDMASVSAPPLIILSGSRAGGSATITGTQGNDLIKAGSGTDTLAGGAGNDILYAGAGADTFLMTAAGFGHDQVIGASLARDTFAVSGLASSMADLTFQSAGNGADTVLRGVHSAAGDSLYLKGITVADARAYGHFIF